MPRLKSVVGGLRGRVLRLDLGQPSDGPPTPGPLREGPAAAHSEPAAERMGPYQGPAQYRRGSLVRARHLARHDLARCAQALLDDVDAGTSRATIRSLQRTWHALATAAGYGDPFCLDPEMVFAVTGVLKSAQYRSAANYLSAAKRAHVEAGHPWDAQLDLCFRQAVRAARRNLGPSQFAEAIPLADMASVRDAEPSCAGGPRHPGRSCLIASWWLLREVEASNAQIRHLEFDEARLLVSLRLPNSKTDPQGLGTECSHTCCCQRSHPELCPYHLVVAHVRDIRAELGTASQWLFPSTAGVQPSKRGWAGTFQSVAARSGLQLTTEHGALRYTGHSARASGAQHLAAHGIELWRIQLFGRWSSAAFLRYVRAAPLAALKHLAAETTAVAAVDDTFAEPARHRPQSPADLLVHTTPDMVAECAVPATPAPDRPEYVLNAASGGKCHLVQDHGARLPPRHWRTMCGWYFGRGYTDFDFVPQPSGPRCRVCFRSGRVPENLIHTSSSTTSSCASHAG